MQPNLSAPCHHRPGHPRSCRADANAASWRQAANVVMPNLSPVSVRSKYALYDNKICTGEESAQCIGAAWRGGRIPLAVTWSLTESLCVPRKIATQNSDGKVAICFCSIRKDVKLWLSTIPKSLYAERIYQPRGNSRNPRAMHEKNKHNVALIDEHAGKGASEEDRRRRALCAGLTHREASVLLACEHPGENSGRCTSWPRRSSSPSTATASSCSRRSTCPTTASTAASTVRTIAKNKHIARKKLTQEEVRAEVIALQDMGHKRLAIEAGEDPVNNPIEYILECINTIYSIKHKNGAIRRVNVNIAATTVENYRKLKDAGIGTYILFQETYHKESYLEAASHRPQARLRLPHRGHGPRHGGRHRRRGSGRAVRPGGVPVRVRRPADARRAPGSRPRRRPAHHQRAPRQAGRRHRPGRVRQRPRRRYLRRRSSPASASPCPTPA